MYDFKIQVDNWEMCKSVQEWAIEQGYIWGQLKDKLFRPTDGREIGYLYGGNVDGRKFLSWDASDDDGEASFLQTDAPQLSVKTVYEVQRVVVIGGKKYDLKKVEDAIKGLEEIC